MEIIKLVCVIFVIIFGLVFFGADFWKCYKNDELEKPIQYIVTRIIIIAVLSIVVYLAM